MLDLGVWCPGPAGVSVTLPSPDPSGGSPPNPLLPPSAALRLPPENRQQKLRWSRGSHAVAPPSPPPAGPSTNAQQQLIRLRGHPRPHPPTRLRSLAAFGLHGASHQPENPVEVSCLGECQDFALLPNFRPAQMTDKAPIAVSSELRQRQDWRRGDEQDNQEAITSARSQTIKIGDRRLGGARCESRSPREHPR